MSLDLYRGGLCYFLSLYLLSAVLHPVIVHLNKKCNQRPPSLIVPGAKKVCGLLEGGKGQGRLRGASHLSKINCIYIFPVSGVQ